MHTTDDHSDRPASGITPQTGEGRKITTRLAQDPDLILSLQLDLLYGKAHITLLSTLVTALTVPVTFGPAADPNDLGLWLAAFGAVTGLRFLTVKRYRPGAIPVAAQKLWLMRFQVGTFASGLLWGLMAIFAIPADIMAGDKGLFFTALAVLYVSALSSGSIAHYGAHLPAWLSFAVPCLSPIMLLLAISGESTRITLSVLLLIYFAFLLSNVLRIHETIMESLLLRLEKDDLLRYLQEERRREENLNRELQADIEQRKKTEEELRAAKEQAEKLAEQLLALSSQDGLTGIANRRRFDEFLRTEWGRATRRGAPLALILGDIDHYKVYNDYYGHQAGDDCLIRIARLLQDYTRRGGELAARYGGEEFAILLADTGLREAVDFAEQLRAAVESLHIRHEHSPTAGIVTMSFGVSSLVPSRDTSPSALIKCSDEALYAAKKNGRNRVEARSIENSAAPDAGPQ